MSDINCSFGEVSVETNSRVKQLLSAVLKKPENFQGFPIFADDRAIDPLTDSVCQIRPFDEEEQTYRLLITDLDKCGILVKNVSNSGPELPPKGGFSTPQRMRHQVIVSHSSLP